MLEAPHTSVVGVPTCAAAGEDGRIVRQRRKIIAHYLKGWFVFDVLSSIPYEQLISATAFGISAFVALLKVRERAMPIALRAGSNCPCHPAQHTALLALVCNVEDHQNYRDTAQCCL